MVEGAVKGAGLSAGDISAVEMVGGTSRVPWVSATSEGLSSTGGGERGKGRRTSRAA